MAISDYSTTPNSNTAINGISIAEGWPAANINNSIRQLMADIKTGYGNGSIVADGQISTAKLADDAVTAAKIADDAVDTAQIADGAVETAQINDLAVTEGKLADNAVATAKIADNAVTNTKLAAVAANTIKTNNTASSAAPTDLAIAASKLVGRGSTGDIAEITLGTNLSMSGATLNASGGVLTQTFNDSFAFVNGTTYTRPHSMTSAPILVQLRLICVTAEYGFAQNEELIMSSQGDSAGAYGVSNWNDATNCYVKVGNSGYVIIRKDTGAQVQVTAANWLIGIRAFA